MKTKSLYLYGIDNNECTEKFLVNLGFADNIFYKLSAEHRQEIPNDVDISDVVYGMADKYYTLVVNVINDLQAAYDRLSDEADENECTATELAESLGLSPEFIM